MENERPLLIMSGLPDHWLINDFDNVYDALAFYAKRVDRIEDIGVNVKFLFPERDSRYGSDFNLLNKFGEILPNKVIKAKFDCSHDDYVRAISWPRDMFQKFDGCVYACDAQKNNSRNVFESLNDSREVLTDDIGEGGLSLRLREIVVGAQIGWNPFNWDRLVGGGFKVYEFDFEENSPPENCAGVVDYHIDLDMALASSRKGDLFLFVNAPFYRSHRGRVRSLSKKLDSKIVKIRDRRDINNRGINFVNLPEGQVLVDSRCSEVIFKLNKYIGEEQVVKIDPLQNECRSLGAFRCRSNVII